MTIYCGPKPRPQPAWMRRVQVGSVIAERGGAWRIVRHVARDRSGRLRAVWLVIRRCSWTRRCYTVVNANDLIQRRFRLIPTSPVQLKTRGIDAKIRHALHESATHRSLTCCDVEGLP